MTNEKPKKTPNPDAMVRVYVWVPKETKEELTKLSKKNRLQYNSVSELIRHFIDQGLASLS